MRDNLRVIRPLMSPSLLSQAYHEELMCRHEQGGFSSLYKIDDILLEERFISAHGFSPR